MKQLIVLTSLSHLGKVAQINERFMRERAARARKERDWTMVNRADIQARKWAAVGATHGR